MQFKNAKLKSVTSDIVKSTLSIHVTVPLNENNLKQAQALAGAFTGKTDINAVLDINPLQPSILENQGDETQEETDAVSEG